MLRDVVDGALKHFRCTPEMDDIRDTDKDKVHNVTAEETAHKEWGKNGIDCPPSKTDTEVPKKPIKYQTTCF